MEEYTSNLTQKINQLDEFTLNSEQKEIERLLVRKEKELLLEQEKWKKILERNKNISLTVFGLMIATIISIFVIFFMFENKKLKYAKSTKNDTTIVLRQTQDTLRKVLSSIKPQKVLSAQHNTVSYKGKKYLKILKTNFMELPTQPKYRYLRLK